MFVSQKQYVHCHAYFRTLFHEKIGECHTSIWLFFVAAPFLRFSRPSAFYGLERKFPTFLPFRLRANNRRSNLTPVASLVSLLETHGGGRRIFLACKKNLKSNQSVRFGAQLLF